MKLKHTVLIAFLVCAAAAVADELGTPFTDNAVLQRGKPVPVWGWTTPGSQVTVAFNGQRLKGTAGDDGRWQVILQPMEANAEPQKMKITVAGNTTVLKNILIGEVWMATGQSNMGWRICSARQGDQDIAHEDDFDLIRVMNVPKEHALEPLKTCKAVWAGSTDKTVLDQTSAPGYFFARELYLKLQVPIGLIDPSYGGTHIDSWIVPDAWKPWPKLQGTYDYFLKPGNVADDSKDGAYRIYFHGVHPFVGFPLRGFIWHQGEGNAGDGDYYRLKLHALVSGYREAWNDDSLYFGIGQLYPYLAPYMENVDKMYRFCETCVAQAQAPGEMDNCGAILLNDLGHPNSIHPNEKIKMGHRYALWARAEVYGEKDLVHCGPIATRAVMGKDNKVRIYFDCIGSGLATRDGREPIWLMFVQENGSLRAPVQKAISEDGTHLVLDWPEWMKEKPTYVRLGWHSFGQHNLMNKEGLPASIFNLPVETE